MRMDPKMDPRVNCHWCRGKLEKTKTARTFPGGIRIEDIPAYKCSACGELFFDGKACDSTLKKLREIRQGIPAPVLSKIKAITV